jgi:hypothetical protein
VMSDPKITISAKSASLGLLAVSGAKYERQLSDEDKKPWLELEGYEA